MIITTNIPGKNGRAPRRTAGTTLWASIDVEWTKNYRIKNGNKPFCYSVVYAALPRSGDSVDLTELPFSYTSVYIENPDEIPALLAAANKAVSTAFAAADHVTGHQFTSDLGVLANASAAPLEDVASARQAWRSRRDGDLVERRVIDTRYDTDHVLACKSRRLVDVCTELRLDVTQPELRTKSMTALHRAYLDQGSVEARERVSVLNLRHSLSTALVAFRATGRAGWSGTLNVNRLLADQLDDSFAWLAHPTFTDLL
ncbi:hypothetical protein [Actinokineospora enzanensis]|uniref:hypothetical protein n=1 Tax=Actinokineospora enzanensis TaxID=155975 RepID=UPI00035CA01D|nr:hypothetical protein [Actinokineospora enzanensis]